MSGNKNVVEVSHGQGEGVDARQEVGQSQEVKEGQELGQRQEVKEGQEAGQEAGQRHEVKEGQEAGQRQEVKEGQEAGQRQDFKEGQEVEGVQVAADKENMGTLHPDIPILFDLVRPALEEIPDLPPAPASSAASGFFTPSPSHLPLVSRPFPRAPGQEVGEGQDVRKGQEEWQEDHKEDKECDEEVAQVFKEDSSASFPSPTATALCPGKCGGPAPGPGQTCDCVERKELEGQNCPINTMAMVEENNEFDGDLTDE